ncbi:hypothetical protein F2Q68_00005961 [Brassica cretica]|uniref:DUF1985 domain-containing protein n=1 Tax=Brassica cretica TaxID=69181 RepID=A0A8S9JGY5_BRACR|nr:hypothetical protein F2Q68_00005961 [Brassica cretica]
MFQLHRRSYAHNLSHTCKFNLRSQTHPFSSHLSLLATDLHGTLDLRLLASTDIRDFWVCLRRITSACIGSPTCKLIVDDPHTLWTAFSGQPLRFGLQEFGTITGLPCGAFPVGHLPPKNKRNQALKDQIWKKLIGVPTCPTVGRVLCYSEASVNNPSSPQLSHNHGTRRRPSAGLPLDQHQRHPGWGVWPDIVNDERLAYMEELIADKRPFKKWMWPGGDTSLPLIPPPTVEDKPVHKKALKSKHTGKNKPLQPNRSTRKTSTAQKQRRISNYFVRNESTSRKSHEQLLEIITELSSQVTDVQAEQKRLLEMIEKLKQRPHTKRSSITSLLPRMKKFKNRRRQKSRSHSALEPTDSPRNNTMSSPLHHKYNTPCQSPILIQYAAQHHRSNLTRPDFAAPERKYPIHISPVHQSENQSPLLHVSVVHTSPVHTTPECPVATPTTSLARRGVIYDASDHSNGPPSYHLLYQGLEIFEPIYDQTPADDGLELPFTPQPPLSPITRPHLTPNPSPIKSTDSGSGFAQPAASVNGGQNESEVMELSDSSPTREALTYTPSDAEMHLANELLRCPLVPSQRLISPLPSQM